MRNNLNSVISQGSAAASDDFDSILGAGAKQECIDSVSCRFNLDDGLSPEGRKVGLLDQFQIWTFLLDPFARQLQPGLHFENGEGYHIDCMLKFFVPGDPATNAQVLADRQQLHNEYLAFKTQQGIFAYGWQTPAPVVLAPAAAQAAMATLTLEMVSDWIDKTGRHASRLTWWLGTAPNTLLYKKIASLLLSMRTTGSISVERVAKPLKNKVMTDTRAKLNTGTAEVLLRAGLNLRLLRRLKETMRSAVR